MNENKLIEQQKYETVLKENLDPTKVANNVVDDIEVLKLKSDIK